MKKHYIDKGKSAFGIPKELINALGETVFEYSKKIYNELVNKFKTKYIPLTDKGLIDIEKITKIDYGYDENNSSISSSSSYPSGSSYSFTSSLSSSSSFSCSSSSSESYSSISPLSGEESSIELYHQD